MFLTSKTSFCSSLVVQFQFTTHFFSHFFKQLNHFHTSAGMYNLHKTISQKTSHDLKWANKASGRSCLKGGQRYPVSSLVCFSNTYPLDSDLSDSVIHPLNNWDPGLFDIFRTFSPNPPASNEQSIFSFIKILFSFNYITEKNYLECTENLTLQCAVYRQSFNLSPSLLLFGLSHKLIIAVEKHCMTTQLTIAEGTL